MPQQVAKGAESAESAENGEDADEKHINFGVPADEHERMRKIKDLHGESWKDVLRRGIGTYDIPEFLEE